MGIEKIAFVQLDQLVRSGKSVSEMARRLNIAKGAVSKALNRLNVAVTKDEEKRGSNLNYSLILFGIKELNMEFTRGRGRLSGRSIGGRGAMGP